MAKVLTRFAPSPTGYLHLGHAYAAEQAFNFAKENNGTCFLRIEDIDHTRCKPEYTRAIYEDLDWLGFDWPIPARRQSDHRAEYSKVIETLNEKGLLYRCFKTRKELPDGIYHGQVDPNEKARLNANEKFAWRLSMSPAATMMLCKALPMWCEVWISNRSRRFKTFCRNLWDGRFPNTTIMHCD